MIEKLKKNIINSNLSYEDKKNILKLLELRSGRTYENSLTLSEGKCPTCGK